MAGLRICSLDGGRYQDWARHFASKKHQAAMHPSGSRRGARANAKRARRRVARHQTTRRYERDQWDYMEALERREKQQSGRHWYGSWSPWGVSAFMGGHPGRGGRRAPGGIRKHLRRIRRLIVED